MKDIISTRIHSALQNNSTKLDLFGLRLKTIPEEIFSINSLTSLDLGGNQLSSIPPEIGKLTNLTNLNLRINQLSSLSPEIVQLTNLTELDLSDNQLSGLPPEIVQLTNLTSLYLGGNKLSSLPPEIVQLTNLTELNLFDNQLSGLPPEIVQLTNLTSLYLVGNKLSSLPPEIGQFTNLTGLYLGFNRLSSLPPEIVQLTNLTELNLFGNQLSGLPPEIVQLTNLTSLDLEGNQLSSLPPEIVQLTNLTHLDLRGNQFSSLPPEIGQLTNLTSLYLGGNQLSSLPPEIGQLTNLTRLNLFANQLSSLPPEIVQLTNLTELDLRNNQLNSLPAEISQIPIILIDNTPFSGFPTEIVEQGSEAILTYLRELLAGNQKQWVSKLVLVGEGGVGKTSLLRALRNEKFVESLTTRGIEIHSLKLPHECVENIELTFNAWDFGGQEIYHATHQFFLTNRSLFILVWNARGGYEQGKLYYWLDAIQARAPQSPVLVVAAWTDERDADLPTADLKQKYPQILGFYEISNTQGTGIPELRDAIIHTACNHLPLMGEKWPDTWLNAAKAIRNLDDRSISPNRLYELMENLGVSSAGTKVLARWMHELGDLLYFYEDDDLDDLVILKPQWVTKYTSVVLDSDDVIGKDGIFTDEHMAQLWPDLDPGMQQYFLRLMEKFDLSYRTLDREEVSLVVERLPLDPPDYHELWDRNQEDKKQREISMKYELNTMLPGIPTWFIARSHRFTTHTHWRFGAVFEDTKENRSLALIQSDPQGQCMQLSVRGSNPHSFFALLRDGLERTLDRYPGLRIIRTIPCPGHEGTPCEYEFDYTNLLRAFDQNPPVEHVQCQHTFKSVPVSQLLFGIHWRTQQNVEDALNDLKKDTVQILRNQKEAQDKYNDLLAYLQREFIKMYIREQSQEDTYCPNIFVLRPYQSGTWDKLIRGQKLEMQLYCQAPGCWHPTEEGGHYIFDYPPNWLRAVGGYLQGMLQH